MYQLLETIKLEKGQVCNLRYHQRRVDDSRMILFNIKEQLDIEPAINVPLRARQGVYKCRIVYGKEINDIQYIPYLTKKIKSLQLVEDNEIDYKFKYANRECFDSLLDDCIYDEILIIRNGFITDTSFSNIIFFDGNRWYTPASPLLKGTKRQQLLDEGKIFAEEIRPSDLKHFSKAMLINSMLDFNLKRMIPICDIVV
ncbi:MAG TPA: aminotransferase class IV [Bacteroidales bacterium]|nr:aminotransferase class IV [Bacteroidales bacterium]HPS16655.1 aminotransferase class IV [Bacteroidales bacterium]